MRHHGVRQHYAMPVEGGRISSVGPAAKNERQLRHVALGSRLTGHSNMTDKQVISIGSVMCSSAASPETTPQRNIDQ